MDKKLVFVVVGILMVFFLFSFFFSALITGNVVFGEQDFEEQREEILTKIELGIKRATEEGKYKCCIEPACTMCYLGDWIWKDGTCDCDGMIMKGEWDKVCPQCKKGIEKGMCKSTIKYECEING